MYRKRMSGRAPVRVAAGLLAVGLLAAGTRPAAGQERAQVGERPVRRPAVAASRAVPGPPAVPIPARSGLAHGVELAGEGGDIMVTLAPGPRWTVASGVVVSLPSRDPVRPAFRALYSLRPGDGITFGVARRRVPGVSFGSGFSEYTLSIGWRRLVR